MQTLAERRRRDLLEKAVVELEWRRCVRDPIYFLTKYVYIDSERDPRGRELFDLFEFQREWVREMRKPQDIVLTKGRQQGATTTACALFLHDLLMAPGRANLLILSKNQQAANKNLLTIRTMWHWLPQWLKERGPKLVKDAAYQLEFEFPDGRQTRVKSFAATGTSGAGETASKVLADEFALYEDPRDTYRTIKPTLDAGGRLWIITTSRGPNTYHAVLARAAARGEGTMKSLFSPWHRSPFMTPELYEARKAEHAHELHLFYQEYPETLEQALQSAGRRRFTNVPPESEVEQFRLRGYVEAGEFHEDPNGPLWLHSLPDPQHSYVIALDPASGAGYDYSAAHIGTVNADGDIEICGLWYSNRIEQVECARQMAELGHFYAGRDRAALMVVEKAGGYGDSIINELSRHLHYPNIYSAQPANARSRRLAPTFGLPVHWTRRPALIDKFAMHLNPDPNSGIPRLVGLHPILHSELQTFVINEQTGRIGADVGAHDDAVMSAVELVFVITERGVAAPRAISERTTFTPAQTGQADLSHMYDELNRAITQQNREVAKFQRALTRATRRRK